MTASIGAHDVGGLPGFGEIPGKRPEPVFREPWEGTVFALTVAGVVSGSFRVDDHKTAVEGMHPVSYMATSYWEQWLYATELCLVEAGTLTREEIDLRVATLAEDPDAPVADGSTPELEQRVRDFIAEGVPQIELERPPRFAVGEQVRTKAVPVEPGVGHTSIPGYAQERVGKIEIVHRPEPLGDAIIAGEGIVPDYVYAVRFQAEDLWPGADPRVSVTVDLFEAYLDPCDAGGEGR